MAHASAYLDRIDPLTQYIAYQWRFQSLGVCHSSALPVSELVLSPKAALSNLISRMRLGSVALEDYGLNNLVAECQQ